MPDTPTKSEDSALAVERERLAFERERLELEKQRLAFDQRFANRHLSLILASILSLAGIFVTIGQVWIERSRAEREAARAATEQERQWKLALAQFVVENSESIFSEDEKVGGRIRNVLLFAFPPEVTQLFIERSQAVAPFPSFRRAWNKTQSRLLAILMFEGRRLSVTEARELEVKIRKVPGDASARAKLLGYYRSFDQVEQRRPHLRWFIEAAPGDDILRRAALFGRCDNELRALWVRQLEIRRDDPAVFSNAASYFQACRDWQRAEDLLRTAQNLDPGNIRYSQDLGQLLMLAGKKREALDEFESILRRSSGGEGSLGVLQDASKAAIEAGDYAKASAYAARLLREADQFEDNWDYGNAIHTGNIILGMVALRSGDVDGAKNHLLRAGATPGSPQLNSFGPNMSLAKELLVKGEREVVIRYLTLCESFWRSDVVTLRKWQAEIKKGRIPDFGANLRY